MKRSTLIILSFILFFPLMRQYPSAAQSQPESDAPYIYYYSDLLNAFVIERADGTDSRTLGDDLIPEDTNTIAGAGWSPSGEWFAWTTTYQFLNANTGRLPFVVNANGERLDRFNDYLSVDMEWSPVDDVILVVGIKQPNEAFDPSMELPTTLAIEMIDVTNDIVIASFETPHTVASTQLSELIVAFDYPAMPHIKWSIDGQHVIVQYLPEWYLSEHPVSVNHVILSRDGKIQELVLPDNLAYILKNAKGIHAGKTAHYLEDDTSTFVIEDIFTNERYEIETDIGLIKQVILNPTQNAALLLVEPFECRSACPTNVWLWEAENDVLTLVLSDSPTDHIEWSPNGMYAILGSFHEPPFLLTMNPYSIVSLDDIMSTSGLIWMENDQVRFVVRDSNEPVAMEVDLSTHNIIRTIPSGLSTSEKAYMGAQWSPDDTKLAMIDVGLVIFDGNFEPLSEFRPDGRSWYSFEGGEAYWHPEGEWLIVAEEALIAGSSEPRWIGIAKSDGTVRRDLASCYRSPCFGWLPDTVDRSNLPAGQDTPVLVEPEHNITIGTWSTHLSWNPDGTQIARSDPEYGDGTFMLIDVESGEITTLDDDSRGVIRWQEDESGEFMPHIFSDEPNPETERISLATSDNGDLFAWFVDESHKQVGIFDGTTEELLFTDPRYNGFPPISIAFSPDGSLVAMSGGIARLKLIDTQTWELITTLNTNATAVAFSPDGQTLAVASSWDIQLWDVETLLSTTS